jgi:hypothetical protein
MLNIEEMNAAFKTIEETKAAGLITSKTLWELKAEVIVEFEEYLCYKYGGGFNKAQLKEMLKFASENAYGGQYEDNEEKFIEVVAFCRKMMLNG